MPKLYEISEWSEQPWWNTGGTRNKKVYLNPSDGKLYYFKQSFNKGERNYEYEFWSEIVASEVGILLGFDLLPYHIANRHGVIGCISESMINPTSEELIEGGKYLHAFDSTFEPEDRNKRNKYGFQLILGSMKEFGLEVYIQNVIKIILFDAFIGNSDRHQENWAFINTHSGVSKSILNMETKLKSGDQFTKSRAINWLIGKLYSEKGDLVPELEGARLLLAAGVRFAPIYDSGCSFGRELKDRKVKSMLKNPDELGVYLKKGMAEIHWKQKKVNHFELLRLILMEEDLREMMREVIEKSLSRFDQNKINELIYNVDIPLKENGLHLGLPTERKNLMIKLLDLRREEIERLLSQYQK
ncbi:hypothetical protein [Reichenbachiella agariperforans]|uniref:hypothetical protein n=1 Tax=Reichenbachiella agariperforans TaxID=156994 RepID=UPI001C08E487|nr:hypothetical protein [Reichenbachiella agariperforans]MBU2915484.1 hypothetical protein [Reichenbachiella agariperforans]